MFDMDRVRSIVASTVRDRLTAARIVDVFVLPDEFEDDLVRVFVVVDGDPSTLDMRKLLGMERHILSRLGESTDVFPIMSYVAKNEVEQLNLEGHRPH